MSDKEDILPCKAESACAGDQPPFDDPELGFTRLANDPIAWLAQSRLRDDQQSPWYDRGRYPTDGRVRDFYLDPANKLTAHDLRDVLRALLPDGSGIVVSDHRYFKYNRDGILDRLVSGEATEYERRLTRALMGRGTETRSKRGSRITIPATPIPDLTWVIDLVFDHPAQAFEVTHAYLDAHSQALNDQVIDGIFDFMATVRCHFRIDSCEDSDVALLRSLPPRSLEYLTASLWERMGYQTSVTKATRDGGKDVVAIREGPGRHEVILIECRQWDSRISVTAPREMIGVMSDERANKGIIVAPGGFSEGPGSAVEYAARIKTVELINGSQLATLMAERYGPEWPVGIDRYIQEGRRIADT